MEDNDQIEVIDLVSKDGTGSSNLPLKRKYSFNSRDSLCAVRGDQSLRTRRWQFLYDQEKHGIYLPLLKGISSKIVRGSREDLEGWSPEINGSRAAFFENFQEGNIVWADLYPNKRIPRAFRTDTRDLHGALVIEVDLEVDSGISKQVLPCTSTVSVTTSATELEGTPKRFQGHHDRRSYGHLHYLTQKDIGSVSGIEDAEEERATVVFEYRSYVNKKGRNKSHVKLEGIDKTSDNYKPNQPGKGFYGASYCIKILNNTFIYHPYQKVGFSIAEYFGETVLYDTYDSNYDDYHTTPYHYNNNSTYNIVQVVHGCYFTKGRKIYARNIRFTHKYNSPIVKLVKNKKCY